MSDSDGNAAAQSPVEVDFTPKPSYSLLFDGMHANIELGRSFLINLELSSGTVKADAIELLGTTCSIWLYEDKNEDEKDHYFHGIVTRVISAGLSAGAYRFKLEVRPWIWLLSQTTDCLIFQSMSAFQIVTKVFRDAGFSDFQDKRQGGAGDIQLDYCVQYRETSLDFVTRLMEQFGFYYYFSFTTSSMIRTRILCWMAACHSATTIRSSATSMTMCGSSQMTSGCSPGNGPSRTTTSRLLRPT